jgi:hypothetical protein
VGKLDPLDDAGRLLEDFSVHLFHDSALLNARLGSLSSFGYRVTELDAAGWGNRLHMLDALSAAFDFPSYFGRNFDALNDCLRDVAYYEYGAEPGSSRTVLAIKSFDRFVLLDRPSAHALLDIWAVNSRRGLIKGHRMLLLLQSDDPELALDPVGATPVAWNLKEWPRAGRGL